VKSIQPRLSRTGALSNTGALSRAQQLRVDLWLDENCFRISDITHSTQIN
jgi:hypothetical protein